jgi:hypothetical protein
MFQDFDLVVLDEVVLLVAQRYRQDVLAAGRFQQREENKWKSEKKQQTQLTP